MRPTFYLLRALLVILIVVHFQWSSNGRDEKDEVFKKNSQKKFENITFFKIHNYYEISVMKICVMNYEQTADFDQSLANWTKRLCSSPIYEQIPNVKNNLSIHKNIIYVYICVRKALKTPPPKYLMFTNLFCF